MKTRVAVVVPNWNGREEIDACMRSLQKQSLAAHIIMVDNGSIDGSLQHVKATFPKVEIIEHRANKGFAGGVNAGIERAIELKMAYVALFNNDAVASKTWLEELVRAMDEHDSAGIVTCKFMSEDKKQLDSTGDYYTVWGLPYPRGRGEPVSDKYDRDTAVLGASGGGRVCIEQSYLKVSVCSMKTFSPTTKMSTLACAPSLRAGRFATSRVPSPTIKSAPPAAKSRASPPTKP